MFSTPILFLIFNRPDTTKIVFERIRELKPKFLFVAADGPRADKNELENCERSRAIATNIDWDCEIKTLFRDKNLGCKEAVSGALSWFFSYVEEGIILEDDCYPSFSFFSYCEALLKQYRNDSRIISIHGCNYGYEFNDASYFFSRYMNAWGWATWRRAANSVAYEMPEWEEMNHLRKLSFLHSRLKLAAVDLDSKWFIYWEDVFDSIADGTLNTWDYFWLYHQLKNRQLSIMPATNLVKNIGFSDDATHTTFHQHPASALNIYEIHNPFVVNNKVNINLEYERKALQPINYMYKRRSNAFHIKNWISKLPVVSFFKRK